NDLVFRHINGSDSVTVQGWFNDKFDKANQLEKVTFTSSGASWSQADLEQMVMTLSGSDGNDTLYGGNGRDHLLGGAGNDQLHGGNGNDQLDGDEGNDLLSGWDGDDSLFGGAGNDSLGGGNGNDLLEGGQGFDALYGYSGNDTLRGGEGNDTLTGGHEVDLLEGGEGDDVLIGGEPTAVNFRGVEGDTLRGGAGNDLLQAGNQWSSGRTYEGGTGNDTLMGSYVRDTYLFNLGDGADVIIDESKGSGDDYNDELRFGAGIASDKLWFQRSDKDLRISVQGGADSITVSNWFAGAANQIETLVAGDGKRLLSSQVQALVDAMAAFNPPASGATSGQPGDQGELATLVSSSWQ
ncbi:calcium binding hemolysin, partial [Aeromonas diversa CDC 2478-85]